MRNCTRSTLFIVALLLSYGFEFTSASAVDFKNQTISMVVGAEPGGGTDTTARLLAPFFEKYLSGANRPSSSATGPARAGEAAPGRRVADP